MAPAADFLVCCGLGDQWTRSKGGERRSWSMMGAWGFHTLESCETTKIWFRRT